MRLANARAPESFVIMASAGKKGKKQPTITTGTGGAEGSSGEDERHFQNPFLELTSGEPYLVISRCVPVLLLMDCGHDM